MNRGLSSLFSLKKTIFALFVFWIGFSPMIIPVVSFTVSSQQSNTAGVTVTSISTVHTAYATPEEDAAAAKKAAEEARSKSNSAGKKIDDALNCGWTDIYCGLVKFAVFMLTVIPNTVAAIIGTIADYAINFSIGHGIYIMAQDITFDAWKMIRDISNIVIIMALFVAAFGFILGSEGGETMQKLGDPKKIVMKTIMVALLINFSFFFCRVIIDAGNLGARIIYNQIGVENLSVLSIIAGGDISGGSDEKESGIKSISLAMLNNIQAQKLLSTLSDSNGNPISLVNTDGFDPSTAYLILGFITFLLDLVLIYLFITLVVLFLGRIVMLLLLTILSPLAMASIPIPLWAKDKNLGWDSWLKQMFGNAFLGIAFLFFVYLSIIFTEINIPLETSTTAVGSVGMLIKILAIMGIKLAFMFFVIFKGKAIAMEWSGVVGEYMSGAIKTASGFAIGAATGGTALLARQTLGRAGNAVGNSDRLLNSQARGGITGFGAGLLRSKGKALGSNSFDVRNSEGVMKRFNQATDKLGGGKIDTGTTALNKGGSTTEGGIKENFTGLKNKFGAKIGASRVEAAAEIQKNQQAKADAELRALEDQKQKHTTEQTNEDTKQTVDANNFRGDAVSLQDKEKELDNEALKMRGKSGKVGEDIGTTSNEIRDLQSKLRELEGSNTSGMSDNARQLHEKEIEKTKNALTTKNVNLQSLHKEKELIDGIIASTDEQKNMNKDIADRLKTMGAISVAQAERNIKISEESAKNSPEQKAIDEADKEVSKQLKELEKMKTKLDEAKKIGDKAEFDRIKTEMDEFSKAGPDPKKNALGNARANVKTAKTTYDTNIGNAIKADKDSVNKIKKDYTSTTYNKTRKELMSHRVNDSNRKTNIKQMDLNQTFNEAQITYANRLDNASQHGGGWRTAVGIVTNGAFGGENIAGSGSNAANNIRSNLKRNK